MHIDLDRYLLLLNRKDSAPKGSERTLATQITNQLCKFIIEYQGQIEADQVINYLQDSLKKISTEDKFTSCLIDSLLFTITRDEAFFRRALNEALMNADDIESRVGSLNACSEMIFNMEPTATLIEDKLNQDFLFKFWTNTIDLIDPILFDAGVKIKDDIEPNNRCVILLQQFLHPPHAPTKDALEFAAILTNDYGFEVMVVNTYEHSPEPSSYIYPSYSASYSEKYIGSDVLETDGVRVKYFQPSSLRFSNENIVSIFCAIEKFDPSLVLVVGSRNLIAEKLSQRAFTVFYPTSAALPLCVNSNFFMWRAPTNEEVEKIKKWGIQDKFLFHQHPGFNPPAVKTTFTRAQFGIPEDAFVFVVVGMRLDTDVDKKFLSMLEKIALHPRAHFVFAGRFSTHEKRLSAHTGLTDRTTVLGFQSDMLAVYAICDAFLNPIRHGGGSAIVYALYAGLPSLSLPIGDAYEAVRDFPALETYDEMAVEAMSLIDDKEKMAFYKEKASEVSEYLCSRKPLVARLMKEYQKFFE
jgi:glycosyltransferase involved in cell wall biosynthesis